MCIRDRFATLADSELRRGPSGPLGAGAVAPSGWIFGPELILTSHYSDQLGVWTYEQLLAPTQ
eukprot:6167225-Alexandrium_andersonii.AAC.1